MSSKPIIYDVKHLLNLKNENLLRFDEEYQRAPAWKKQQRQLFVDSILRGYPIPAFYFHKVVVDGRDSFNVIDGQQRIRALLGFTQTPPQGKDSGFRLLSIDKLKGIVPFLITDESPWENKRFSDLDEKQKQVFYNSPIVAYEVIDNEDDRVRDLFIRLQGGTQLSAQDKRDAYPGELSEFVLRMGGRVPLNEGEEERYPGHRFFNSYVRGSSQTSGKRFLAAQLLLLLLINQDRRALHFGEIKSPWIDRIYSENTDFRISSDAQRYGEIADGLCKLFDEPINNNAKFWGYESIHLFLLMNSLLDDSAADWEEKFQYAFGKFMDEYMEAKRIGSGECFDNYAYNVVYNPSTFHAIRIRHRFFLKRMLGYLFGGQKELLNAEKQYLYLRDGGRCMRCKARGEKHPVAWDDAIFYPVSPLDDGGKTADGFVKLDKFILMHRNCDPQGENVQELQEWWFDEGITYSPIKPSIQAGLLPPDGTQCRTMFEGVQHTGKIESIDNRRVVVVDGNQYRTFSAALKDISGKTQNGWEKWEILLNDGSDWQLAYDWGISQSVMRGEN